MFNPSSGVKADHFTMKS